MKKLIWEKRMHIIFLLEGEFFMHKEQAYVETAPRDIIQFKYAESLQIQ